jgi:hypothetical protein
MGFEAAYRKSPGGAFLAARAANPISRNFTSLLKPALFNDIIKYSYKPNSDT